MKTLIRGGQVYDGQGGEPYMADLLMEGGLIQRIGVGLQAEGCRVIEAEGMAVTPGFVDMHRHADLAVFSDATFGNGELAQGITSIVGGPCGLSPVPVREAVYGQAMAFLAPCLGPAATKPFARFAHYMDALAAARLPVNMGMMAATGAIKICVKGFEKTPFTPDEMKQAQTILKESLEAGALGVSVGIMYPPECYTGQAEYISLLGAASPYGRPICFHIRTEGDSLTDSVKEAIAIGDAVGLPVHISHFKATGIRNWKSRIFEAIDVIERARAGGMDVTVDFYPYTAGATTAVSLLPPSMLEEDNERLWDILGTPEGVRTASQALGKPQPGWDNMGESIGWERIIVTAAEHPQRNRLVGGDMRHAADVLCLSGPEEALCALLSQSRGNVSVVLQSMDESDTAAIAGLPYSMLISDALYGEGGSHPRRYGAFPRFLRRFVFEKRQLSLAEAIGKMTYLPAQRMGLEGIGRIYEGGRADVNVFDPLQVMDMATYTMPGELAVGMSYVLLGGDIAFAQGMRGAARGSVLSAV